MDDTERAEERLLFGLPAVAKDFRSGELSELDGGEPDTSGGGVNQNPVARRHVDQVVQGNSRR